MKSITKIIFIIIAFTIILPDIKAQTTEQMRIWAFNGVAVNFTVPTVTQQIISTPIAGANGAYASYYDENDQLVVRVVDNTVYDEENNPVDQLFDQPASNFTIVNQMVIFPQSLSNNCEFNIYYIVISNGNQVNVRYATYSKYLKQIVEEHEIWSYSYQVGSRADWNFAISDFIDDTDEQRMYVVLSSHSTSKSNDTLKIAYFRGPTFRLESIDLFGNGITANAIGEVELASDLSFLTFTTPYNTTADLHVYPINVNTGMFSGTFTHLNVSTGSSMFVGLEISHDNDYLYTSNLNDKIYRINVTNPSLPYINGYFLPQSGQLSYTSSRIERAHNGYYYMVNSNGELGYFTSNFNGISYQTNIGVNAVINNSLHANEPDFSFNMYVIPGQVDGCQYNYTTGSEISCCESYNESVVIDPGSEVSVQGDDIVVTGSNVVWNTSLNPFNQSTDIYMKGDLIIQPGAKLTITGLTLHFKENQKVQLNQNAAGGYKGAYLYLDNSKLTAFDDCDEAEMWLGVEANGAGNSYLQIPFSSTKQPQVEMRNGSVIEFAEAGINAQNGSLIRSYSGCSFKDNVVDVHITNFSPQNYSQFYETSFYTTQNLYDQKNTEPTIHAHIWTAPGVQFKGCSFRNDATSIPSLSARGLGIISDYSKLIVVENNSVRGEFENLWFGIKCNGGASATLTHCDFSENLGGAWFINNNALSVTKCDFNVGNTSYSSTTYFETYGLYLESCTGYQIEENDFHDGLLGMVVYNSGYDNNRIYKNDFYNINLDTYSSAIVAIGFNALSIDIINGLQFICNDFNFTIYAIALLGGNIVTINGSVNISFSDICKYQGYDITNQLNVSSDNTFWLHGLSGEHDFCLNTYTSMGRYRYNGAYDNLLDRDANINSYNSYEVSRYYYGTFTTREQECPSNLDPDLLLMSGFSGIGELNEQEAVINSEIEELSAGINETALIIAALTANQNNVSTVHNMLMSASPYLSDTVLSVYLNNTNVSEYSRAAVLVANSPLPSSVKSEIYESELTDELKAYINQFQDGVNLLEQKYLKLESIQGAKQQLYDKVCLAAIQLDTTAYFNQTIELLELSNDIHAKECLANLYVHNFEYDKALDIYESLINIAEMDNNTLLFNNSKIQKIIVEILLSPINFNGIIEENADYLWGLACDYETKEGGSARAILASAGMMKISPITILPSEVSNRSANLDTPQKEETPSTTTLKSLFRIYPNPANDQLAIEFVNPQEGNCTFNIYSLKGELLQTVNSNQQLGFMSIPVSSLAPGSYIIECPQLNAKQSFIISR